MIRPPDDAVATRWLSCHVDYACRHSGACCRSGWPLPVDARAVAVIDAALASGRLRTMDGAPGWRLEPVDAPADIAGTFRQVAGACVFHVPGAAGAGDRRCAVHAALGHVALPSSCQHFPRVCLIDRRGVRVSLSHYCPTAASMLIEYEGPVTVVDGPAAVPGVDVPEGLDARRDLPPRLTGRVLTDLDGFDAWERHLVEVLAGEGAAPRAEDAVAVVLADARRVAEWRPGVLTFGEAVTALARTRAPVTPPSRDVAAMLDPGTWVASMTVAAAACRLPWTWADAPADLAALDARYVAIAWDDHGVIVRRYLAAKAFGSWLAYQADAALGVASWLRLCLGVLRLEAVRACAVAGRRLDRELLHTALRQADLLLVHYADSLSMARACGPVGH